MSPVYKHAAKEIWITLAIWAMLMAGAIGGLFLLKANAMKIIEHIHYVNVSRGAKAAVLYAEAQKNAAMVLEKAEKMNRLSGKKYNVPAGDEHLKRSLALFEEAFKTDSRQEFAPERTIYYELLGQVHDAAGNRVEQLLAHTRAFMAQRDTEDAKDFINLLREADPDSGEPFLLLAQLHELNHQTTEALTVIDDLYTSYPITPKARWVKARLLSRMGRIEEGVMELSKAVEAEPDNLTYRKDLANFLGHLERTDEAVKVLAPGLKHGGRLDAAYMHSYGIFLTETAEYDEAITVLKEADKLAPYSGDVQFGLARAYHLAGKQKLAASTLRRATEIKPELHNTMFEPGQDNES